MAHGEHDHNSCDHHHDHDHDHAHDHEHSHHEGPHVHTEVVPVKSPEDTALCILLTICFVVLHVGFYDWMAKLSPPAHATEHGMGAPEHGAPVDGAAPHETAPVQTPVETAAPATTPAPAETVAPATPDATHGGGH